MSTRSEYARIRDVEMVGWGCGCEGCAALDQGNVALVAGDGGTNLYIEGTPAEMRQALTDLLVALDTIERDRELASADDDEEATE